MTAIEYIEASGVPESRWTTFRQWYDWHADRGLVGVAKDGDEITGVAVARTVDGTQKPDHYEYNPDGDTIFVDLTVCSLDGISSKRSFMAMKTLLSILWDRFGPRKRITFNRNGAYKEYDYHKFMRKAMN